MESKLRQYADPESILHNAPGPSPWYFRQFPPLISDDFVWDVADEGLTLLRNASGDVVLILDLYCYGLSLNATTLLIWHVNKAPDGCLSSVAHFTEFIIISLERLLPIEDVQRSVRLLKAEKRFVLCNNGEVTTFLLPNESSIEKTTIEFPSELRHIDELLVLGTSPVTDISGHRSGSLCLFVLSPKNKLVEGFPQDWFNQGNLDFGYQWVTRMARDTVSGKIYGEGIRIGRFVLDESLRKVEKWFRDEPYFDATPADPKN